MPSIREAATPPKAVLLAIVGTAVITAATIATKPRFGFDHLEANVSVDTVAALTATLAAFLFYSRVRQRRLLRDVVLAAALSILALGNVVFSVLPTLLGTSGHVHLLTRVDAALMGALLFTVGSWMSPQPASAKLVASAPLLAAGAIGVGALVGEFVGHGADSITSVDSFGATTMDATSLLQGLTAAAFMLAALGLMRRSVAEADELLRWFAVAAVFAAASRLEFALSGSVDSSWSVAGNVFRLAFYATLGVGAAREIHLYSVEAAAAATLEERRRVARDLHDGMAQELAFIASQARWLADDPDPAGRAKIIASAAQRALDESRRAITALTKPLDEPLDVAVAQAAEEVARRLDVRLDFEADKDFRADDDTREALVRIVREAVANAGRHSGATRIKVQLRQANGVFLCISDDGAGFDRATVEHASGHLGLVSMRERAEARGGKFSIHSARSRGTRVEVWVP
jgi:signal transduction histidine kinase